MPKSALPEHHLGLELNDRIIRFAVIRRRGQRNDLRSYGAAPLPDDAIVNGVIVKPEIVAQKIKLALGDPIGKKISTKYAVVAVPESHVFITVIGIPKTDRSNLAEAVQWEALQHIPFSSDEVQFDWTLIGHASEPLAQVGAVPKNVVDALIRTIRLAGLTTISLVAESSATIRSIISGDDYHQTLLVIDLGANHSSVILTREGTVYFSSTISEFAGHYLTQLVCDKLRLNANQAEKAKRLFGLNQRNGKGEVRRALMPAFLSLVNRLSQIERFIGEHLPKSIPKVAGIVLTGGGSELPGLIQALSSNLRLPVIRPLPADVLALKPSTYFPNEAAQFSLATAFGLALNCQ